MENFYQIILLMIAAAILFHIVYPKYYFAIGRRITSRANKMTGEIEGINYVDE